MYVFKRFLLFCSVFVVLGFVAGCHPTTAKWDPAVDLEPDSVLQPTSENAASHRGYVEGRRLMQESRYEEAESRLSEAVALDSQNAMAWRVLAHCLWKHYERDGEQTRLDKAIKAMQRTCELHPKRPDCFNDLGQLHLLSGHFKEALNALTQARSRMPDWPDPHYHLAQVHASMDSADAALDELEAAIRLKGLFRTRAAKDPAFVSLRNLERFQKLIATE